MITFSEAYLTDRLSGLIDEYADRFGRGPPMLQLFGDLVDQAFLIQLAIDRDEPIRHDEICWPSSPDEVI